MNNDTWTYDDYLEWDREYREVEYLLETYSIEDTREYIAKKYGVDND